MQKEKYHIEFVFDKAGKSIIWDYISSAAGLSEWFSDKVATDGKIYTFTWGKYSAGAEIISLSSGNYIRFHWLEDENPNAFFELLLHKNELTGEIILEITDFAEKQEKDSAINLWESQIKTLTRVLGL
jgi:hypothetical protein